MDGYTKRLIASLAVKKVDPPVKLSGGGFSQYYVDCRSLFLMHHFRTEIGQSVWEEITKICGWDRVDAVGGKGYGALLLAIAIQKAAVKDGRDLRVFAIRVAPKEHGIHSTVIGDLRGKMVLVVDDVMSTGETMVEAIRCVEEVGAGVRGALVLVDRSDGADLGVVSQTGVSVATLSTLKELLQIRGWDNADVNAADIADANPD